MREMTCTTLYDQPCLPSIHGNATYSGLRNRIKHLDVLRLLDEKTVFIVNDWAMKFLPQRYRESQQDWFGKRGISWHISVVYRRNCGKLQWQCFVHIIQSCSQDSPAVVTVMEDVLRALKREYPEITTAYFQQDSAGCYHSATTILSCPNIAKTSAVKIARLDFSDPQLRWQRSSRSFSSNMQKPYSCIYK